MGATDIFTRLSDAGIQVAPLPDGRILAKPRDRLTDELRKLIRRHREELLRVLADHAGLEDRFVFAPLSDPANDDEALQERAAILAVENGWNEATALLEARRQSHRERCWRAFLRNAARVLEAPAHERDALLRRYEVEAERLYDAATARDMAQSLRGWVHARAVH